MVYSLLFGAYRLSETLELLVWILAELHSCLEDDQFENNPS